MCSTVSTNHSYRVLIFGKLLFHLPIKLITFFLTLSLSITTATFTIPTSTTTAKLSGISLITRRDSFNARTGPNAPQLIDWLLGEQGRDHTKVLKVLTLMKLGQLGNYCTYTNVFMTKNSVLSYHFYNIKLNYLSCLMHNIFIIMPPSIK